MLNEDIISDLKAKARAGAKGLEDHPDYPKPTDSTWRNARVNENAELSDFAKADVIKGLRDLAFAVHKCAVDHGWWETDRNFGEQIALMHSELSEALESWRDNEPALWFKHEDPTSVPVAKNGWSSHSVNDNGILGKPCGVTSEFADVIIRILDTCEQLHLPIAEALILKHNYNLTRPYRHGGKLV